MAPCPVCGESAVIEYDPSAGNSVCTQCGYVVDENAIVSDITFGEASTGAAVVEGSYLSANSTRAPMSGPRGRQQTTESREQTIANGRRQIGALARALNLGDSISESATRFYALAVQNGLVQGRKSMYVLASCLYMACRFAKEPTMLIDISDMLQVNVFVLGSTYLKLVRDLHLGATGLPTIDPSMYISRFASMLEFGDETQKVAYDATRLVKRFDKDWMSQGRRPAGIAGACLLLAARMNNFRRSVLEMVQVVKIADVTLKKRLEEFKRTPSGKMTVSEFRTAWLEESEDPPSFQEGVRKARKQAEKAADIAMGRARSSSVASSTRAQSVDGSARRDDELDTELVPTDVTQEEAAATLTQSPASRKRKAPDDGEEGAGDEEANDAAYESQVVDAALADEFQSHLSSGKGLILTEELDERERLQREIANREDNRLDNLNEDELDKYVLGEDEVTIKTRLWMEFNKEYLENLAERKEREANGEIKASRPRGKRQKTVPRDSTNPAGATAAESIRKMMTTKAKKFSKKVNYDQIAKLFGDDTTAGETDDGAGGRGKGKGRSRTRRESTGTTEYEDGQTGWGHGNRAPSRDPSRYNTPALSEADTDAYGHTALFEPADDAAEDNEEDEEEEEEDEAQADEGEDAQFRRMRRGQTAQEDDEEEGEV